MQRFQVKFSCPNAVPFTRVFRVVDDPKVLDSDGEQEITSTELDDLVDDMLSSGAVVEVALLRPFVG